MRKICVVTGARSEYGLLYWLMKAIKADATLDLQIIASCMHLSPEFGLSYRKILEDGFEIDEKIEMLLSSDTASGITQSMGLGVIHFAGALGRLKPELVVLLGDRFETLAAAQAALIAKIPVAHIHGGELSLGAYDDGIRHSVTKMSHLHFVATDRYKKRVIQLGEHPDTVFQVGAMVLDSIQQMTLVEKASLEQQLGMIFKKNIFAITFHPETLGKISSRAAFSELLQVLSQIKETTFIFTKGNADTDGRIINEMIEAFCAQYSDSAKGFVALGHQNYLSLLKIANLVIGNSSSGIIEAPYFRVPTVNIGDRQKGRIRADSVIDCEPKQEAIHLAIQKAFSEAHQHKIASMTLPYGEGNVAKQIVEIIRNTDLTKLVNKTFYDLKEELQ